MGDEAILAKYRPIAMQMGMELTGGVRRAFVGRATDVSILLEVQNEYGSTWTKAFNLSQGHTPREMKGGLASGGILNLQIAKVKTAAKKYDCTFTGSHKKYTNGARIFELERKGVYRWRLLGDIERGDTGFARIIKREKIIQEVKVLCKDRGFIYTQTQEDARGRLLFGVRLPRKTEVRFVSKADLKKGVNPFANYFQRRGSVFNDAQIQAINRLAKKVNTAFTGRYKGAPVQVELEQDGRKKWVQLGVLKAGGSPFTRADLIKQKQLAEQYCAKYFGEQIVFTGKVKKGKYYRLFELKHIEKEETRWAPLGDLKRGHNPWKATFDATLPAILYVAPLKKNSRTIVGYGITNGWPQRRWEHNSCLRKAGWQEIKEYKLFEFKKGADAKRLETQIKRRFPVAKIDAIGFRSEATALRHHQAIIHLAAAASKMAR